MSPYIVYIKLDQSVCLNHRKVCVKDLASVYCSDPELKKQVEKIRLFTFPNERTSRETISVMRMIEEIKKVRKEAEVVSLGEQDVLIYYKMPGRHKKMMEMFKVGFICLTVFFGAGISIMGYNNDVDIEEVFRTMYEAAMGTPASTPNFMHLCYALGLFLGLVIFFNHASRKRLSDEPTPVEVQMRTYEKNVNAALITGSGRKEEELDVDS